MHEWRHIPQQQCLRQPVVRVLYTYLACLVLSYNKPSINFIYRGAAIWLCIFSEILATGCPLSEQRALRPHTRTAKLSPWYFSSFPSKDNMYYILYGLQSDSVTYLAYHSVGCKRWFPRELTGPDMQLTTHLKLVPNLKMRGAVPPISRKL